jgi:hypothetical protein
VSPLPQQETVLAALGFPLLEQVTCLSPEHAAQPQGHTAVAVEQAVQVEVVVEHRHTHGTVHR